MSDSRPAILAANGRPARQPSTNCPQCGKGKELRVKSGGFGEPHDVCGHCGFEGFERSAE